MQRNFLMSCVTVLVCSTLLYRFEEMDSEATEWVNLAYVKDKLRVLVKTVMNLRFP